MSFTCITLTKFEENVAQPVCSMLTFICFYVFFKIVAINT